MMHELAHCQQMNHSKAFWAVRNQYADQMRGLWSRGYTGDGLWGRGTLLETGEFERNTTLADDILPEHLCGGTYRSRRRKRKPKEALSYQEQKERRIKRKFGANGVSLGDDQVTKSKLEGKWVGSKPRVAASKRGRDLRAAAALARFEQQKKEEAGKKEPVKEEDVETASGSETESDYEEEDTLSESGGPDAVDIDGKKLVDNKGGRMVRVCEDENADGDQDAQNELLELQSSMRNPRRSKMAGDRVPEKKRIAKIKEESPPAANPLPQPAREDEARDGKRFFKDIKEESPLPAGPVPAKRDAKPAPSGADVSRADASGADGATRSCPICSVDNEPLAVTCSMCSHVLDARQVPGSWHCEKAACRDSLFLNAGDCGVCGVCGGRRGGI